MSKIVFENPNGGGPLMVNANGGDGVFFEEDIPRLQQRRAAQQIAANSEPERKEENLAPEHVAVGTSAKAAEAKPVAQPVTQVAPQVKVATGPLKTAKA